MVTDHRWRLAIWTTAEELGTDVVAYNSAIASCRAQWQVAWHLLAIQLSQGVKLEPNVRSYGAVASACTGEVGHWAKAKFLLEDMAGRQVTPNLVSFNTIAGACRSAGRWLQVLELVGSSGQQPDVISLTLAVGAAEQAASWGAALQVLDQAVGLQPDMMFYSTTMSACQGAGQWKGVLHLLASDRVRECLLSTVAYNVAISSSEGSWQLPLELLEFMKFSLAKPDLYSFNSSIRACGKGSWRVANEMLRAAGRVGLTPDVVTYSSLAHVDAWHFSILALSTAQEWRLPERSGGYIRETIFTSLVSQPWVPHHWMVDVTCKDDQKNPMSCGQSLHFYHRVVEPEPSSPQLLRHPSPSFTILHLSGAEGSTERGDLQQLHLDLFLAACLGPAMEIAGPRACRACRQRHPERCGGGVWQGDAMATGRAGAMGRHGVEPGSQRPDVLFDHRGLSNSDGMAAGLWAAIRHGALAVLFVPAQSSKLENIC